MASSSSRRCRWSSRPPSWPHHFSPRRPASALHRHLQPASAAFLHLTLLVPNLVQPNPTEPNTQPLTQPFSSSRSHGCKNAKASLFSHLDILRSLQSLESAPATCLAHQPVSLSPTHAPLVSSVSPHGQRQSIAADIGQAPLIYRFKSSRQAVVTLTRVLVVSAVRILGSHSCLSAWRYHVCSNANN